MLGWPKRCELTHAFLWEYSYKRLKLGQLLGQLVGVFLTQQAVLQHRHHRAADQLQHAPGLAGLGFGRMVVSQTEVPNILAHLV